MKFRKITSSKYLGQDGYSLQQMRNGSFSILKDGVVTDWGTNFQSVKAAEDFLNNRNCNGTSITEKDSELIYSIYCSRGLPEFGNKWYIKNNFWIQGQKVYGSKIQFKCSDGTIFKSGDDLVAKLETVSNDIFAKTALDAKEIKEMLSKSTIVAKRQPASSRNGGLGPKDLMKVRSSNVWAIGFQVSNDNHKLGDVYVQFKGKEGGPDDVYKYYDVPSTLYRRMITTPSKGAFVWKYLRNNFPYSKLTGDKRGKLRNAVN